MQAWLAKIWQMFLDFLASLPADKLPKVPAEDPPVANIPQLPIKKGSTGPDVEKAQKRLVELGWSIDVDGDFGDETERAVAEFQELNQIGKTKVIGSQTWGALFSKTAKGPIKHAEGYVSAAEVAHSEAVRKLKYSGPSSEAEKYLASVRSLIKQPSGRFPWCAAFVFWCLKQCWVDMSHLGTGAAYVPSWMAWAENKGYWHSSDEKSFNPRKGDIVLFDWDDDGEPDHIGFVWDYAGGSTVITCEGNTSTESDGNGDQTAIRSRHWDTIEGFIRVEA